MPPFRSTRNTILGLNETKRRTRNRAFDAYYVSTQKVAESEKPEKEFRI
jgi:hypothetical protein